MPVAHIARAFVGASIGAVVGYAIFAWLVQQGFYALALPGAALGLGCGLSTRRRSLPTGVVCGVLAVALGVVIEWRFFPYVKDSSLSYFVGRLGELKPMTLLMIAVGGLFGAWFGMGRRPKDAETS